MKRLQVEIAALIILGGFALTFYFMYDHERKEHIRTERNQVALMEGVKHWKTKDSLNAATIQELTLSKGELKKHEAELVEQVKELGIKVKRLERVTQVGTKTEIRFVPIRKDSLIYIAGRDSIVKIECLEYKDPWIDFVGCNDDVQLVVRDSLDILAHRVPKNFWFIKFGTKAVRLDIISKNPYTDITYAREIKMRRK